MTVAAWDAHGYDRSFGFVSDLGRELLELVAAVPGERILDLGCGTGTLAAELTARGALVHGIDADASMIAKARADHPDIGFEQADGHRFVVAAPMDAVFSNAALHWMLQPAEVIDRVHEALRPGGRFVGEFGGQGNVATIRTAVLDAAEAIGLGHARINDPWFFPSTAEYATLLEDGGFRVRSIQHFDRPTPLDDCPEGVIDWIRMFGQRLLDDVPAHLRAEVTARAAERCRPQLYRDGRWVADYVRLRFLATRER